MDFHLDPGSASKCVAIRPSLNLEIAVTFKLLIVMNFLGLIVLIWVMQMLEKQGRWFEMLLIITPEGHFM